MPSFRDEFRHYITQMFSVKFTFSIVYFIENFAITRLWTSVDINLQKCYRNVSVATSQTTLVSARPK